MPSSRQSRILGLWTAAWLFVLLLALVLRFGDLVVQWPVLPRPGVGALVPLLPGGGPGARCSGGGEAVAPSAVRTTRGSGRRRTTGRRRPPPGPGCRRP